MWFCNLSIKTVLQGLLYQAKLSTLEIFYEIKLEHWNIYTRLENKFGEKSSIRTCKIVLAYVIDRVQGFSIMSGK